MSDLIQPDDGEEVCSLGFLLGGFTLGCIVLGVLKFMGVSF